MTEDSIFKEAAERYADKYWEDFAVHDVIAQTLLHTKNDSKNAFIAGCEYADKEIELKDQEIQALKEALNSILELYDPNKFQDYETVLKCRKLIGD
jgi:hypothetical protein